MLSEDGENMVEFRSIDKYGNEEAPQSIQVWIDQTAPVIQVSGSTDFYQADENVTFTATGTDTLSGVQSISFKLDNQEFFKNLNQHIPPPQKTYPIYANSKVM
ncbi:hypothetical protein [Ectobacillus funiculus]|uniref:Ig-like domain-containing protein n=1 Tax=Ectobacillus funiculus TaxID=137993 RepID=A0ABV5WAY9_9BACI